MCALAQNHFLSPIRIGPFVHHLPNNHIHLVGATRRKIPHEERERLCHARSYRKFRHTKLLRANRLPGAKKTKSNGAGGMSGMMGPSSMRGAGEPQNSNHIPNLKPPGDGGDRAHMNEEYVSKFNYDATKDDELTLRKGMRVIVLQTDPDGWWYGKDAERPGQPGYFPSNYVVKSSSMPQSCPSSMPNTSHVQPASDCISVVRTLYAFNSGNPEELAFEQDEMLDIIEQPPDDPEWWLARNSEGLTGLVPMNYVEVVDGAQPVSSGNIQNYDRVCPQHNDIENMHAQNTAIGGNDGAADGIHSRDWYFGNMKRADAEQRLQDRADNGEFLVRGSETSSGDYSISMKMPGRIRHFKVNTLPNGVFGIGQRKFDSMDALLEHYKSAPIYTSKEQGKVYLSKPMGR
uniref:cytoplasmic protein NCK1 isoform X2 n=1 Tax=Ciona intestinalis TaxID=7719 RepID=UPI000EF4EB0F|nr:cytoplasmic protein NCK1 isoform X2 [Ciona intestinalis]|eukprot:XP_026690648.1 cytoplasmic protein NCK1 isoform X2 [Ciona intestinalis]